MRALPISTNVVRIVLKALKLATVCIALSACAQQANGRDAKQVSTSRVLITSTSVPEAEPISTFALKPSSTAIFTSTPWPTVSLPKPAFNAPPSGTMLVMQYTEIVSRSAYRKRDQPFYGALDSVVWAIPADGTSLSKWNDDGRDKVSLKASPDGTMVAYVVNGKNGEYNSVWVAKSDGSNPQQLTPDYLEDDLRRYVDLVGWSVDSKKIAYRVDYFGGYQTGWLYIADIPSRQVTKMRIEAVKDANWLPRSSHLILTSDSDRDEYLFDINSQEVISLTSSLKAALPDGTKEFEISNGRLTVYALDGSQLYQIELGFQLSAYSSFTWSPDGQWFVFRAEENRLSNIYKVSQRNKSPQLVLEGSQISLTTHPWLSRNLPNLRLIPTWSSDGLWFVVFNFFNRKGEGELYAINVETNEIRTVMTISPFRPDYDGIGSVVWLK